MHVAAEPRRQAVDDYLNDPAESVTGLRAASISSIIAALGCPVEAAHVVFVDPLEVSRAGTVPVGSFSCTDAHNMADHTRANGIRKK